MLVSTRLLIALRSTATALPANPLCATTTTYYRRHRRSHVRAAVPFTFATAVPMSTTAARFSGPVGVVANDAKTGAKGEPMTPIPSASLVILCPISSSSSSSPSSSTNVTPPEYATLMVQRKSTGSFRSAVVFPGGLLDQADQHAMESAAAAGAEPASPYLDALRLCALRETFEETGLLLLPAETPGHSRAIGPQQAGFSTEEWTAARKAVHDDARAFPALLHCVMSSSSQLAPLRHHSNWVTPRTLLRPAKRFDTHFFITVLDKPDALGQLTTAAAQGAHGTGEQSTLAAGLTADGSETTSLRLARPHDLLSLAIRDEIILFPPQYYLLSDVETTLQQHRTRQGAVEFAPLYFGDQYLDDQDESAGGAPPPFMPPPISSVARVEPQGLPAHGAMIARTTLSSTGGQHGGGQAERNDDDQIFVLPLALPGDVLRPVKGQDSNDTHRRNRVYCTPRSKGEGGGLMVHGAHRRAIPGLHDFRFGHLPAELEGEAADATQHERARNAKL